MLNDNSSWDLKYRPQTLFGVTGLVGQRPIADSIASAIMGGVNKESVLRHTIVLSGLRGTGKTTTARIIAKLLNCHTIGKGDCCPDKKGNVCPSCKLMMDGNFSDLMEIDAATNNGVDFVREITADVPISPLVGKVKVYVLDEAHQLSLSAWNALLKNLEEPPAHAYWVLVTTEPHKILPTVMSRALHYQFKPLTAPTLLLHLKNIADKEQYDVSDAILEKIVEVANGSVRGAIVNLETICRSGAEKDLIKALELLSLGDEALVSSITGAILKQDISFLIESSLIVEASNYKYGTILEGVLTKVRSLFIAKVTSGKATHQDVLNYGRFIDKIMDIQNKMDKYKNQKVVYEAGLFELAYNV